MALERPTALYRPTLARRSLYFAGGFLVVALSSQVLYYWPDIIGHLTGRTFIFDQQSSFLKSAHSLLGKIWWIVGLTLLALRLAGRPQVRVLAYGLGALTCYACIVAFVLGSPIVDEIRHERTFDASLWRANPGAADHMWPIRLAMVDDLLRRHRIEELSRDSVISLLGPPDSTPYFRDWDLVYYLGPERGLFRIDSEWLTIRIGPSGLVSAVRISRD